jgi:pyrimidine-nucleoside phosphorylase
MRAVDLIRKKREGQALVETEIEWLVRAVADGSLPDYQAAAWLMAVLWRGLEPDETAWLTLAMARSGECLDLADLEGPRVDKHSTGGVGDKTSLVVAPLVAACGGIVPMISGRGLGHTGGTLDKLEAIPGFRVRLTPDEVKATLRRAGCVIAGQTERMVPADRRLYALRDVTATIESVPLITASIMSKKVAEGIDALVLDVKAGRGAFMKTAADAGRLAASLVATGRAAGIRTEALVTRMDAPIGRTVGHAVEVLEAVDALRGRGPEDLSALCRRLAERMIVLAGLEADDAAAARRVDAALESGRAFERFLTMVEAQGGDPRLLERAGGLEVAQGVAAAEAPGDGVLATLDAELVGRAALALGAGRDLADDPVDPAVGVRVLVRPGEPVRAGQPVLELLHRDGRGLDAARALAGKAITVEETQAAPPALVLDHVTA